LAIWGMKNSRARAPRRVLLAQEVPPMLTRAKASGMIDATETSTRSAAVDHLRSRCR
jgi:hypothetical protein